MSKKKRINVSYISKMLGVEIRRVHSHADLCPGVRKAKFTGRWSCPDEDLTWLFFDRVTFLPGRYTERDYLRDLMGVQERGLHTVQYIMGVIGMSSLEVILCADSCPGACRVGRVRAFPDTPETMDYFRKQAVNGI